MLYAFAAAPREQFALRNLFYRARERMWEDFQAGQNQACTYLSIIVIVSFSAQKTETVYFAHSGILYIKYTRRGCKFKVQAKRRDCMGRNRTKIKNNKITVKALCWWKSSLKICRVYNKFSVR